MAIFPASVVLPVVVKLANAVVPPNLVIPVLLVKPRFPSEAVPPTAPSKLILPVPLLKVKSFVPSTVDLNAIAESVVFAITLPVRLTAPL